MLEVKILPSEKILAQKKQIVADLVDKMKNSASGVFVDYKGINVADDTALRKKLREAGVSYTVIKNTMARFAIKELGFDDIEPIFNGTTALAVSENDLVAPAKILCDYAKDHENFTVKAGFVEGRTIEPAEVKALAALPPKEVLVAKVLGSMNSPITGLVTVLNGNIRGLAVALNAIAEKKSA